MITQANYKQYLIDIEGFDYESEEFYLALSQFNSDDPNSLYYLEFLSHIETVEML